MTMIGHNGGPALDLVQGELALEGGRHSARRRLSAKKLRGMREPRAYWQILPNSAGEHDDAPPAPVQIPAGLRYVFPVRDHAAERAMRRLNEARRAAQTA